MWPFRKRYPALTDLPDDQWAVGQGELDGKRVLLRYNNAYRRLIGHPQYSFRVGVAVPLLTPRADGLPDSDEAKELDAIEAQLCASLEEHAEAGLAFVLSTDGMREFVFYTSNPESTRTKLEHLRATITGHEIQGVIQHDPKWKVFREFVPR